MILGLDLSLRQTAAVALPAPWTIGDWSAVRTMVVGRPLTKTATEHERIDRLRFIAENVIEFALKVHARVAFIEGYAFAKGTQAHSLAELGGHVRVRLRGAGIEVRTANMASARKLLLGKVPRSDAKIAVFTALRSTGWQVATLDESDAFACANFGLSELGKVAMMMEAA
jgi:hypothetical protein